MTESTIGSGEVLDAAEFLDRVLNNSALAHELIDSFLSEYRESLASIEQSIDRGDAPGLRQAAHALAGTLGNFSARVAYEVARRLEALGRSAKWAGAEHAYAELEAAIAQLVPALVELKARLGKTGRIDFENL